ncbi:hypothetical protein [Actinomadura rubrisoli]|nr:hypothetical protein [Actinomadura rubrisoli]
MTVHAAIAAPDRTRMAFTDYAGSGILTPHHRPDLWVHIPN